MVFSSLVFLFFFLPVFLLLYFAVPARWRNAVLLSGSLLFYAWGEPVYVTLMALTICIGFFHGKWVDKVRGNKRKERWVLTSCVCLHLALLGFFKYADFAISIFNQVTGCQVPLLHLPLPIGISFYTFQTLSYTIDVHRGQAPVQDNLVAFGAYVSMFPQLIAGPIVRYQDVAAQMNNRTVTVEGFANGIQHFLWGLFEKVLLANNIGLLWESIQAAPSLSTVSAWLGAVAFAAQIYFDFAGYSDMAIGLGRMMGFAFPRNFNDPYCSQSISEFWRRWHITLGAWFREYVYIPLGGNRKGLPRTILNLAIVWALTGLWHGAAWNFVCWGLYFGALIILERLFLGRWLTKWPRVLRHAYAIGAVLISWIFFACDSMAQAGRFLRAMFGGAALWDAQGIYGLYTNLPLLIVIILCCTPVVRRGLQTLQQSGAAGRTVVYALCLLAFVFCIAYLVDATYNPFLYFRF